MIIHNVRLVNRWDKLMADMSFDNLSIQLMSSELEQNKQSYGVEQGISVAWMLENAKEILGFHYESGHMMCDNRFEGEQEYKTWVSETSRLKRLIVTLQRLDDGFVVEW